MSDRKFGRNVWSPKLCCSYVALLYVHLSDIPSLANSIQKSLSHWQAWKPSPSHTDSGMSPAVPAHCQALTPQPGVPDTGYQGWQSPISAPVPPRAPGAVGSNNYVPQHMHSPWHIPPTPTARARPGPHRTKNTGRCFCGSPRLTLASKRAQ